MNNSDSLSISVVQPQQFSEGTSQTPGSLRLAAVCAELGIHSGLWGERGEHAVTVCAGDFLHVPAWLVHREINPSQDVPFRWVVIRSSSEPIVVNLPDDVWK